MSELEIVEVHGGKYPTHTHTQTAGGWAGGRYRGENSKGRAGDLLGQTGLARWMVLPGLGFDAAPSLVVAVGQDQQQFQVQTGLSQS